MANGWGGRRENAGRKRKAEKYAEKITSIEDKIADKLPKLYRNLQRLADGGIEVTRIKRERVRIVDGEGERFEMAIVEAVTEKTLPDRKANEYLIDRIAGRPTQEVDLDVTSNGATVGGMFAGMTNDELEQLLEEGDSGGTPSAEDADTAGPLPPESSGD